VHADQPVLVLPEDVVEEEEEEEDVDDAWVDTLEMPSTEGFSQSLAIVESHDRETLFVLEPTMDDEGGGQFADDDIDDDINGDLFDADVIAIELRKRRREE